MRIIRHSYECPADFKHSVIALGNFDGVHKGHKEVIHTARKEAEARGVPSAVLTFEPHPASVLHPGTPQFRIEGFREKAQHIKELGVDALFVEPFNAAFSKLPAEEFVKRILVEQLAVSHVVIGRDFIFGYKRSGHAELLRELAGHYGFGFTQVKAVLSEKDACSSSAIRAAIKQGEMKKAAAMLGRPYSVEGRVQKGDARGRTIGVPTANVVLKDRLHPAHGVYVAHVVLEGKRYDAVVNIGKRPTFGGVKELLEVHILNFSGDIYTKRITVEFVAYIRMEQKFENINALKHQIDMDIIQAGGILRGVSKNHRG